MPWQVIVFSRVIVGNIIGTALLKKLLQSYKIDRKKLLCWQFLFCLAFSVVYALISGFTFRPILCLIVGIGILNSFGAYCQWQAIDLSLSKTSLFTQADDLISLFLCYWLLNETRFLNIGLVSGLILCFGAATLLMSKESNVRLIKFVGIYSVIWGVAGFLKRYFAILDIPFAEFLCSWYAGSLLGALCIFFFSKGIKLTFKLTKKEARNVGIVAIAGAWGGMVLGYWAAKLAPLTVYQPIFLVSEAVFPTLLGFYVFKEIKTLLSKREKTAFLLGFIGVVIIAFNHH